MEYSVSESAQAEYRADPDVAVAGLQDGIDFAVKESALGRVSGDELFRQAIQSA